MPAQEAARRGENEGLSSDLIALRSQGLAGSGLAMPRVSGSVTPMAEPLRDILGNTCRLARTTLCCKWNARGPGAGLAIAMFADQARELSRAQDSLAERLRIAGLSAMADDDDDLVVPRPQFHPYNDLSAAQMSEMLANGHSNAILSIEAGCDVAREYEDQGCLHVLVRRLVAHQGHWLRLTAWTS